MTKPAAASLVASLNRLQDEADHMLEELDAAERPAASAPGQSGARRDRTAPPDKAPARPSPGSVRHDNQALLAPALGPGG